MSMFSNSQVAQRMQENARMREQQAQFDALSAADAAAAIEFDPIDERKAVHASVQMRLAAMQVALMMSAMVSESSETEEDEDTLLPSEILDDLMLSIFAEDDEDEDSDIDATVKAVLSAHISDALSTLGVSDDVIEDMFDADIDVADAAIESASETIIENLPDDGDDFNAFVEAFAYALEEDEAYDEMGDDDEQFDAVGRKKVRAGKKSVKKVNGKTIVYKAVKAIRNGKKVVINKRIAGKIKLSAGQKAALRKARRKATTGSALRKQMKSLKKGRRMGLYPSMK